MIGAVESHIIPTQYLVFRVTPEAAPDGWSAGVSLRAVGTDSLNGEEFEDIAEIAEGAAAVVLRVGPFRRGSTAAVTITLRDADEDELDSWTDNVEIVNENSLGIICRQAAYDILEDAAISGAALLTDGLRRPASAFEDMPFTGASCVIEVGSAKTAHRKYTKVRSKTRAEVDINVYVFHSASEGLVIADNLASRIQEIINATPNMYLGSLGVNNFSWSWDVDDPEIVDVKGSHVPVVVQGLKLTVPVEHVKG